MTVSICIPTYNQGQYIEQAIFSAFNQSVKPLEIIVFDDCSTDNTSEILLRLSKKIPILKIVRQPVNVGIALNVDGCLKAAISDFVVRLDSDDCLYPEYAETLSKLLIDHPAAGYAHAAVQEIDQFGNLLKHRSLFRKSGFQSGDEALRAAIKGYRVAANIIMFRRSSLVSVGYSESRINFAEDYYLSASLAAKGYGNVYSNDTLAYYRVWIDAKQVRPRRKLAEIIGYRILFENILEPAYQQRGWNQKDLYRKRADFASNQADCLEWELFTLEEKIQLIKELYKLSSNPKVKLTIWLYLNKFGYMIKGFQKSKSILKNALKSYLTK